MENEIANISFKITDYLLYIAPILHPLISGLASYIMARRKSKAEIQQLIKKHELDLEKQREIFNMEKEKMEIEHKNQLELKQKETENQLGTSVATIVVKEMLSSSAGRDLMRKAMQNKN